MQLPILKNCKHWTKAYTDGLSQAKQKFRDPARSLPILGFGLRSQASIILVLPDAEPSAARLLRVDREYIKNKDFLYLLKRIALFYQPFFKETGVKLDVLNPLKYDLQVSDELFNIYFRRLCSGED